jgi:hypothetical protein
MKYEIKSSNEVNIWNYVKIFLHSEQQMNREVIVQNLKLFVPFFKKHAKGIDYSLLANNSTEDVVDSEKQTDIENMESIKKTLSAAQDEDIWMEVQHFRDHKHRQGVYTMMMQNKNSKFLGDEFFSLVTHEKSLITGGFSHLGE